MAENERARSVVKAEKTWKKTEKKYIKPPGFVSQRVYRRRGASLWSGNFHFQFPGKKWTVAEMYRLLRRAVMSLWYGYGPIAEDFLALIRGERQMRGFDWKFSSRKEPPAAPATRISRRCCIAFVRTRVNNFMFNNLLAAFSTESSFATATA